MPHQITITGVTGNAPYQAQVCNISITNCFNVPGTFSSVPYTFNVPAPLDVANSVIVIVSDDDGCETFQHYSCPTTPTPTPTPTATPTPTPTSLCRCITADNTSTNNGSFDYTDCNGNNVLDVIIQSGITYYTCGSNPTNETNLTITIGDPCSSNQFCPTPTCPPTPTPTPVAPICALGDYLVFVYEFPSGSGVDLDTVTTLTQPTIDGPLGYCYGSSNTGSTYMFWGGDNRSSGGSESVYFKVNDIKTAFPSAPTIQFTAKAHWYTSLGTGVINLAMYVYSGGTMVSDGNYGFTNVGGSLVATYTFPLPPLLVVQQCAIPRTPQCLGTFTYNISTGCIIRTDGC